MAKKLTMNQQRGIIEGLCLLFANTEQDISTAKKIIKQIYKISHLNGTCKNKHLNWHKEGFYLIKKLINGIIDVKE